MLTKRFALGLCAPLLALLVPGYVSATTIFIDDVAGFNAAVAGLAFAGTEDFESSTLAPNSIDIVPDFLAPGIANGVFPTGTNPATGLTVQSNSLAGAANVQPGGGLATASAPLSGTPTDQVSSNDFGDSFDMLFGLANTDAVLFNPLVFDALASNAAGTADLQVFDTANVLIASLNNISVAAFTNPTTTIGVVAMAGEDIGRINLLATSVGADTNLANLVAGADNIDVYVASTIPSPMVPEPASLALFGLSVVGVGLARRRKRLS